MALSIEDMIQVEIEFTTILAKSIIARNVLLLHQGECEWCDLDLGCEEGHAFEKIDADAFELAMEEIQKRNMNG